MNSEEFERVEQMIECFSPFGQARAVRATKRLRAAGADEQAWLEWTREMGKIHDAETGAEKESA